MAQKRVASGIEWRAIAHSIQACPDIAGIRSVDETPVTPEQLIGIGMRIARLRIAYCRACITLVVLVDDATRCEHCKTDGPHVIREFVPTATA